MQDIEVLGHYFDQRDIGAKADRNSSYAIYVRLVRQKRNLSRNNMAEQLGICESLLLAIENGLVPYEQVPSLIRDQIEASLGTSFEKFVEYNQGIIKRLMTDSKADYKDEHETPMPPTLVIATAPTIRKRLTAQNRESEGLSVRDQRTHTLSSSRA